MIIDRRFLFALVLSFLALAIASCVGPEGKEQYASDRRISRTIDSLSSLGEHGYHVAYFVIGRFQTSHMERSTFDVSVIRMDERLLERPIRFRVLDTWSYLLTYALDEGGTVLAGEFDRPMSTDLFQLHIARPPDLDSASFHRLMKNASAIDHEIKVYRY
jgi:hypothetical protein